MVLDTSAVFAMLAGEADAPDFQDAIMTAGTLAISAITVLETRIVLHARRGMGAGQAFEEWLAASGVSVVPLDQEQARIAFDAFRRYGKGQGHPAQLNILDCAAYALAKTLDEPLLFKGDDFARTDIHAAR